MAQTACGVLKDSEERIHAMKLWYGWGEVRQEKGQSRSELERLAERGDVFAKAKALWEGWGCANNEPKAAALYLQLAKEGSGLAQCELGFCYKYGDGVDKDVKQAFFWFQKAAQQHHPAAQNSLGYCFKYGEGVAKDLKQAFFWYRQAAEQGYALACSNLGYSFRFGEGVELNLREAVSWYRKAADRGDIGAIRALPSLGEYQ